MADIGEKKGKGKIWRDRAARYRALARAAVSRESKESLYRLADDCEHYADKAEAQPGRDL